MKAFLFLVVIPKIACVLASSSSSRPHLWTVNASSASLLQLDELVKNYCSGFEVFDEQAKIGLVIHPEPKGPRTECLRKKPG